MRLDGLGFPVEQIAKLSGYTYNQVRRTLESPYYQECRKAKLEGRVSAFDRELSKCSEEMKARLRELVPIAISSLENALRSEHAAVRLRAAIEILDRDERFNKTEQVAAAHIIPEEQVARARKLARELTEVQVRLQTEKDKALTN